MIGDLIHRIEKAPMKFPKVTVVLVSAALLFVLWDQTREQPDPIDANRLTNLRANPVELSAAVDWIFTQIPDFCSDAAGEGSGTKVHADCVEKPRQEPLLAAGCFMIDSRVLLLQRRLSGMFRSRRSRALCPVQAW